MATFLLYPKTTAYWNSDGVHAVVVPAADAASAPAAARDLFGPNYGIDVEKFEVVEIGVNTAFYVQGHPPVGRPGNPEGISTASRGGNRSLMKPV